MAAPVRWIELTPDYRCNNRCIGCFSVDDGGARMSSREAVAALVRGRGTGATQLWLGGGEPTLRGDLVGLVREAKKLGYTRIKLQTNGMLLAHAPNVAALQSAGLTEIAFSVKGPDAASHDHFARAPGTFDLMVRGIDHALAAGLAVEADVLVYASSVARLSETIAALRARGVPRFRVWMLSAATSQDEAVRAEVPRVTDVVAEVVRAMDAAPSDDPEALVSLHTPACTLPATHRRAAFDPAAFGLLVMNPGGHAFRLEESPIEGGTYLPGCSGCAARATCGGLRADYLRLHGEDAFRPIAPEVGP